MSLWLLFVIKLCGIHSVMPISGSFLRAMFDFDQGEGVFSFLSSSIMILLTGVQSLLRPEYRDRFQQSTLGLTDWISCLKFECWWREPLSDTGVTIFYMKKGTLS
jgi:hypothetical protein